MEYQLQCRKMIAGKTNFRPSKDLLETAAERRHRSRNIEPPLLPLGELLQFT